MKQKKGFGVRGLVVRTVLAAVTVAIGLSLAGCGEQMARIEENQLKLQEMVKTNAEQIAAFAVYIEQNQKKLQAGVGDVQNDVRQVASDAAAFNDEQIKLHKAVQNNNLKITNKMAVIEENQNKLQVEIEDVQSQGLQVAANVTANANIAADIAAGLTAVGDEQIKLRQTVQNNSQQLTNRVAVIEQNQQEWQSTIEGMQENIQKVAANISSLGQNLSKLQEMLQVNALELTGIMNVNGQEQLKFQEKIQKDLLVFNDSMRAIKQSQDELQLQIENVRNSAEIMSNDIPEAIEQLKEDFSRDDIPAEPEE